MGSCGAAVAVRDRVVVYVIEEWAAFGRESREEDLKEHAGAARVTRTNDRATNVSRGRVGKSWRKRDAGDIVSNLGGVLSESKATEKSEEGQWNHGELHDDEARRCCW